jgi:hypothetical protein
MHNCFGPAFAGFIAIEQVLGRSEEHAHAADAVPVQRECVGPIFAAVTASAPREEQGCW